jgi:hypothetical protein
LVAGYCVYERKPIQEISDAVQTKLDKHEILIRGKCPSCAKQVHIFRYDAGRMGTLDRVTAVHSEDVQETAYPWGNGVPLQSGEKVLAWVEEYDSFPDGYFPVRHFIITNQRLVETKLGNWPDGKIFSPDGVRHVDELNSIYLENIKSVSGQYLLAVAVDNNDNRIESEVPEEDVGRLTALINDAASKRKSELQEKMKVVSVTTDFSWLKEYLDKGGIVLTTIKCPQCGAGLELPKSGTTVKCQYCGAGVYAHDVLEKFKGLVKS